jgi:hypothetical protein
LQPLLGGALGRGSFVTVVIKITTTMEKGLKFIKKHEKSKKK